MINEDEKTTHMRAVIDLEFVIGFIEGTYQADSKSQKYIERIRWIRDYHSSKLNDSPMNNGRVGFRENEKGLGK
jgi:hypothetical protein